MAGKNTHNYTSWECKLLILLNIRKNRLGENPRNRQYHYSLCNMIQCIYITEVHNM